MKLRDILLGRRLANREQGDRTIGWFAGVPAMGLDGLGSSSYGPEAALTILIPLGAASLGWIGWVIAPIVALLAILYLSYRQTILAYPSNGGAYTVAKENLGATASLLAASALMIDYVLNVAVGISAGVGALTSSVPALHDWTLALCLAILALVALANLRGTREAGWLFALPTYLFLACFLGLIGWGLVRLASGHAAPVVAPPPLRGAAEGAGLWLLLRAFAAGCTAMTGVEAVSNGVSAFRVPVVREAQGRVVLCGDGEPAGGAVPLGQYELRRLPAHLPAGGARRSSAARLRGGGPTAGLLDRRAVPDRHRRRAASRPNSATARRSPSSFDTPLRQAQRLLRTNGLQLNGADVSL